MALHPAAFPASRNIAEIAWDDESESLYIRYLSGATYRYDKVPEQVVHGFSTALSATQYLRQYIETEFFPVRES